MAVICIEELEIQNDELSYLSELNDSEVELTRGGWVHIIIGMAWVGYCAAKELKSRT